MWGVASRKKIVVEEKYKNLSELVGDIVQKKEPWCLRVDEMRYEEELRELRYKQYVVFN